LKKSVNEIKNKDELLLSSSSNNVRRRS